MIGSRKSIETVSDMTQQALIDSLPQHLRPFVKRQNYEEYTPQDQAAWRFIMSELTDQLAESAHPVYMEGLAKTGISLDHIPSIEEMNDCLRDLDWRAVVVDGFIPPAIFMEFQALKILVIALDMRSSDQLLYTPAPDIVHESAGHAPFIVDIDYAEFLQRFGVGVTSPTKVDGKSYDDMFQYTSPNMGGAVLNITYNQADTTNSDESLTSYALAFSPEAVEGLTIGFAAMDDDSSATTASHVSDSTMYVKYVYGSATLGYQQSEGDSDTDSEDVETTAYGISYAVSDELSISYGASTAETPNDTADKDQEASAISASYTSGGMTIGAAMGSVDNVGNVDATDEDTYEISVSFAF
jgi:hypothetical protein